MLRKTGSRNVARFNATHGATTASATARVTPVTASRRRTESGRMTHIATGSTMKITSSWLSDRVRQASPTASPSGQARRSPGSSISRHAVQSTATISGA